MIEKVGEKCSERLSCAERYRLSEKKGREMEQDEGEWEARKIKAKAHMLIYSV